MNNTYKQDVLNCMANLSNDEVFTLPRIVRKMLDLLPQELFKSTETTFLDPCCKTGVFLREITKRLLRGQIDNYDERLASLQAKRDCVRKAWNEGEKTKELDLDEVLENEELDFVHEVETRLKHILTKQVFGIAITEMTALMSRRTLYCSKNSNGEYSIAEGVFIDSLVPDDGKILFEIIKHSWDKNGKCDCCGANKKEFDREDGLESYAYPFIHWTIDEIKEKFDMENFHIDVIVGNPPYHLKDGGNNASAMPLYNKFVTMAKKLSPRYITMIIPSRFFTSGKGLDEFREEMINDKRMAILHDFANVKDIFPGIDLKGGVCYFLWDANHNGKCNCYWHTTNADSEPIKRYLHEEGDNFFIRENELLSIKNKVGAFNENPVSLIVSPRKPYGLETDTIRDTAKYGLPEFSKNPINNGYEILGLGKGQKRIWRYIPDDYPLPKRRNLGKWKVFISEAYGCGNMGEIPSTPVLGTPVQLCTETFLDIGPFKTREEAQNFISYLKTKFFRALVGIKKQTQHASREVYSLVPMQDFSKPWTDEELYKKYNLSKEEILFIERNIEPME